MQIRMSTGRVQSSFLTKGLIFMSVLGLSLGSAQTFPVTLEHKYGSTTVPVAPERIVSVGYNDQDALFALGAKPVGIGYWFGPESGVWPWAEEAAEGATPEVLALDELNLEAILTLEPDLITAQYSGLTREDYERLSQIAPTLAQSGDYVDYGTPWQEMTQTLGRALGKGAAADVLVAGVEDDFARAAAANPEFRGKSIALALYGDGKTYYVYQSSDVRARIFAALGFAWPQEFDDLAGDSFYFTLSRERFDLIDRDVLVVISDEDTEESLRQKIEGDRLLSELEVVKDGRVVYVAGDSAAALGFSSVLSLPYALKSFLPDLSAAVAGLE